MERREDVDRIPAGVEQTGAPGVAELFDLAGNGGGTHGASCAAHALPRPVTRP